MPRRFELPFLLISGNAHPALARDLAEELGVRLDLAEVGAFADGETRIRIQAEVRDSVVVIVQPTSPPVNEHLMTLRILGRCGSSSRCCASVGGCAVLWLRSAGTERASR